MNLCTSCNEDFAGLSYFDAHRVGKFPQTGPAEYEDRLARGLVSPDEDWSPELGRRCLTPAEMREKGWELNDQGRWHDPVSTNRAREAFSELCLTP